MNNLRYAISESPHQWSILAGITAVATLVGTMAIIIYDWSHVLAKMYFYVGLALAVSFLVLALIDWKDRVEAELEREEQLRSRRSE
jgi:hypothetical protein